MPSAPVITRIETFRNPDYPLIVWAQIHSSDGLVGLGETSFSPDAVEINIHTEIASYLLGEDPNRLDIHWDRMSRRFKVQRGRGVDSSSVSAIDMALWDLYAKRVKQPLYQVLGGLSRDRIRVYNTCAGYSYGVKTRPGGRRARSTTNPISRTRITTRS